MHIVTEAPDFDQAVAITSLGFVQPITEDLAEDVRRHLVGDIVLTLLDEKDEAHGYAVFRVDGNLLYLGGVMLSPDLQRHALGRRFVMHAQSIAQAQFLGLRTQSPIMWSSGRKLCKDWYPVQGATIDDDPEILEVLRRTVKISGSTSHIDRGCYGQALYGEKPVHDDPAVQRWWDSICNFESGDAVICIGRF